jgi:hypothetical protein
MVHQTVRTADGLEFGNVVAVDEDKLSTIQGVVKKKEYSLPHTLVECFNSAKVRLNNTRREAQRYLIK